MRLRTIVLGAPARWSAITATPRARWCAYLLSGEYTEHRDGQGTIVHKPGEQWVEGADVAHWSENRGTVTAVLINVDVLAAR